MPEATTSKIQRGPAQVEMTVSGTWMPAPRRGWRGEIQSSEPVVGVSFLTVSHHTQWCKSDRGSLSGLEVTVMLGLYDKLGLDIQVNFSVGNNGPRWRTLVDSAAYLPKLLVPKTFQTGSLTAFAKVEGKPAVELKAIFLAGRDVRVGRNGLWHLRKELVEFFPESLRTILTCGRSGKFDSAI